MIGTSTRSAVVAAFALAIVWSAGAQDEPVHHKPGAESAAQPAGTGEKTSAVQGTPEPLCPVTGKPIDRSVYTRFRGKRVYFSSKDCIEKFLADPGKYATALKQQWKLMRPLRVQVACPVTGGPIDKRFFVATPEVDIFFASADAKAAWLKDPKPYQDKLDACFTFQTGCGTCGGDILPQAFIDFEGRRIYFCCLGCGREFQKEPQEFLKALDDQIAANEAAWKARQAASAKAPGTETPGKESDNPKP